jgi:8-oxo-dGTP pyrophosphatase MutT (NUDIX family)
VARGGAQHIPRPNGWRLGAPNPWLDADLDRLSLDRLRVVLERLSRRPDRALGLDADGLATTPMRPPFLTATKDAAVLAPLFHGDDGELRVVLTRRSGRLRNHRGEVAFPGGRVDEGETTVAAALREAEEEIDLPRDRVEILGSIEPLTTVVSSSLITPYIGYVDTLPPLRANAGEVDRVFHVALAELVHPECYREEIWDFPDGTFPVWFFDVEDDTVWGATSRMLRRLLDLLLLGDP